MNVQLLIWDHDELRYAIMPTTALRGYHYREWDGVIVGMRSPKIILSGKQAVNIDEEIMDVFDRLGLEDGLSKGQQDLRKYLHRRPPFKRITMVLKIGWCEHGTASGTD